MSRHVGTMPDLAWFAANREANYRVRDPLPGEVDKLARELLPAGAAWDGPFAVPAGQKVQVVAMKLPLRRVARFLNTAPCNDAGELSGPLPGFVLLPIMLGARVALSS